MTLPYAEPLVRLEPQPRVIPEPARVGEPGGPHCGLCDWLADFEHSEHEPPIWYDDNWARGAFAFFSPGQVTDLHPDIIRTEGRVHFAGEHCSLHHAWIQGALESGIRAAKEIHEAPAVFTGVAEA